MVTQHSDACAIGARAELRGPCDCGAVIERPWRVRSLPAREHKIVDERDDLVEIVIDRPLTTREAMDLALTLQDLTIMVSHRNIVKREKRRR
jgi:hypothetical protein